MILGGSVGEWVQNTSQTPERIVLTFSEYVGMHHTVAQASSFFGDDLLKKGQQNTHDNVA